MTNIKADPLADIVRAQREEIDKYKWLESEKAGGDIGWERAQREWMLNYCADWIRHGWHEAIDAAMRRNTGDEHHELQLI